MGWIANLFGRGGDGGGVVFDEVADTAPPGGGAVARTGFVAGIPRGGTTEYDQGTSAGETTDRTSNLQALYDAYLACPWASVAVDTIARTITSGGVEVVYESDEDEVDDKVPEAPPGVVKLRALLDYCNPTETIVQLCRGVISDLEVYGDAFVEVVWLGAEPLALFSLDVPSMRVIADEHGNVTGYKQVMGDTGQSASFEPREIIHIALDTPGSGIYGVSPTQKAILSLTTWLFAAATLKEVMRNGDPVNIHVDFPEATPDTEVRKWRSMFRSQNIGPRNIGTPITTKGGTSVTELKTYAIENYTKVKTEARDEILSEYGVPPAKAGVIESGNLGGGTGTSQDKTFNVNTCGPIGDLVMQAFIFALLQQAYGIRDGWTMRFRAVDLRDDKIIDDIAHQRVTDGRQTINRARAEIGEPSIGVEGDIPVLVDRTGVYAWVDIPQMSKAALATAQAPPPPPVAPIAPGNAADAAGQQNDTKPTAAKGAGKPAKDTEEAAAFAARFDEAFASVRREIRNG